jgi:hypothetical protein
MISQWQETENKTGNQQERFPSRQAKIMAAKAAFGEGYVPAPEREETQRRILVPGLWRVMASAMLLLLLLFAFSSGFSYHGFNREYVQQKMEEETLWKQVEEKVQSICVTAIQNYGDRKD